MKTLVTAIILSAMLSVAGNAKERFKTESVSISNDVKKITVTGNTIVYLVQSETDHVAIEQGDAQDITVKQIGHTLSIGSDTNEPAIVTVYFKDIYRVDASGNATVISVGKLDLAYLQILLKDKAEARIKADTRSLYTVTDGLSRLELIGTTLEHIVQTSEGSRLKVKNFLAGTTRRMQNGEMMANGGNAVPATPILTK